MAESSGSHGHKRGHKRVKSSEVKMEPLVRRGGHKRVKKGTSSEVKIKKPLVRCGWLKLKDEFVNKTLFICSYDRYKFRDYSYVVRAINLGDLLTSSSSVKLELGQVACMTDKDLPASRGCGVFGSKIVFASGHKASDCLPCPDCSTQVYGFDIHDPKQEIVKMEGAFGTLNDGKEQPLVVEFAGKLYVLSIKDFVKGGVPFEVFDPEQGTWSALPMYPYCGLRYSYAIADTKLFMSCRTGPYSAGPIYCFDLADADHDPEWRRVPTMCEEGPFPFVDKALVLDLPQPEHSNKKLLFTSHRGSFRSSLAVYLMSLDENQEYITQILVMKLPAELPGQPNDCHFFHLGANDVCCVSTWLIEDHDAVMKPGMHTVRGAAIPFQFEFDISKVDTDRKNCFTVRFEHPRIFEYHSGPDCYSPPETLGCFVL